MTRAKGHRNVRGVVLDIEGTTTPMTFVHDILFPYARAHLREYLHAHGEGDRAAQDALAQRMASLMDVDSKDPELKALQGKIWEEGYRSEQLHGVVYADVRPALERWQAAGVEVAIYSSGSVLAQRLLLGSTIDGDLTSFIKHFFDTAVGAKRSPESYQRIAAAMEFPATALLFVSDITAELHAARSAGFQVALCVRQRGTEPPSTEFDIIRTFDQFVG